MPQHDEHERRLFSVRLVHSNFVFFCWPARRMAKPASSDFSRPDAQPPQRRHFCVPRAPALSESVHLGGGAGEERDVRNTGEKQGLASAALLSRCLLPVFVVLSVFFGGLSGLSAVDRQH